jgi:hypothetical protein
MTTSRHRGLLPANQYTCFTENVLWRRRLYHVQTAPCRPIKNRIQFNEQREVKKHVQSTNISVAEGMGLTHSTESKEGLKS